MRVHVNEIESAVSFVWHWLCVIDPIKIIMKIAAQDKSLSTHYLAFGTVNNRDLLLLVAETQCTQWTLTWHCGLPGVLR